MVRVGVGLGWGRVGSTGLETRHGVYGMGIGLGAWEDGLGSLGHVPHPGEMRGRTHHIQMCRHDQGILVIWSNGGHHIAPPWGCDTSRLTGQLGSCRGRAPRPKGGLRQTHGCSSRQLPLAWTHTYTEALVSYDVEVSWSAPVRACSFVPCIRR